MLSGRDLCDVLIARPEEFYRICWVVTYDDDDNNNNNNNVY